MLSALDRKLVRDLWQMKGQALAITLVMACGVATLVMSLSMLGSLQETRANYYDRTRFADVFAGLKRAPNPLADRIAEIPGVARVQPRVVVDVTLDVPDLSEPAAGRLISIPDRPTPVLNDLHLRTGRYIDPERRGEVLASEGFVLAHHLVPGDKVRAVINGRRQQLTIVGVALSPEYIFQIRPGDLIPDDKHFAVFWMGRTDLGAAFNMQGAFNDVSLTLTPDASEPEVLRRVDRLLEPYGGLGAHGRADQVSHRFLNDEMQQLRRMATIMPAIFLGVAGFLLSVVLSRLVGTQREQIAALKAFGYSHLEVGLHYLKMVLVLVVVGVVLGTTLGTWLGHSLTVVYTKFYRFPVLTFHLDPRVVLLGLAVAGGAAVLGTVGAVRRAVVLPPAEALRPEPPATYRPTILERAGLQRLFAQTTRMILRNLERTPVKAFFSILAIALSVSILILGTFTADALDYLTDFQFVQSQRHDLSVTFTDPVSARAFEEVRHLPGVLYGEPFRSLPVRLRSGHHLRLVSITGLGESRRLFRLLDADHHEVDLPDNGLVLSAKLAELLHVGVGDAVTVEVLEGARPVREVAVAGLVNDYLGTSAYMNLRALNRFMREGSTISGAYLSVDPEQVDTLYSTLKGTPKVAGVNIQKAALRSFQETVAQNILIIRFLQTIFAGVIAFGVVYNNARIALSERSRELATLRVIGFSRAEISWILLGELGVITLSAIAPGLSMGYLFAGLMSKALDTDMYRIPLVINRSTFGFAVVVVLAATLLSALVVRRRLDHLDLVSVLKSKE
jgi:putative ABC transport system permease protein